jgi:DNA replication protein DnaC
LDAANEARQAAFDQRGKRLRDAWRGPNNPPPPQHAKPLHDMTLDEVRAAAVYHRVPKLFEDLALARGDGRHPRLLRNLGRADLLILDDWGLEPLDAAARHDLLEILEERYGRRSTAITSQLPVDRWHEIIGDPTYADAILDRLVHNAHRIELTGESMRRTRGKQNPKG